jgi:hypothetical protein
MNKIYIFPNPESVGETNYSRIFTKENSFDNTKISPYFSYSIVDVEGTWGKNVPRKMFSTVSYYTLLWEVEIGIYSSLLHKGERPHGTTPDLDLGTMEIPSLKKINTA